MAVKEAEPYCAVLRQHVFERIRGSARNDSRLTVDDTVALLEGTPESTTGVLHVYIDSKNGDNNNNGLTRSTPRKTLSKGFELVPLFVRHDVIIHLKGTFTDETIPIGLDCRYVFANIYITGEDTYEVIDGPYEATSTTVSSIGFFEPTLGEDALLGTFVEILSGPAVGDIRLVQRNTETAVTPIKDFSIDPGVGTSFQFVRPSTKITHSPEGAITWTFRGIGPGAVKYQKLTFEGPNFTMDFSGLGCLSMSHVALLIKRAKVEFFTEFTCDLYPIDNDFALETSKVGGITGPNLHIELIDGYIATNGSVFGFIGCQDGPANVFIWGTRALKGCQVSRSQASTTTFMYEQPGYATPRVSAPGGFAVFAPLSTINFNGGIIENATFGILMSATDCRFTNGPTGRLDEAGIVIVNKAQILTTPDFSPTDFTGKIGDICALTNDKIVPVAKWADLEKGDVWSDLALFSVARKVPV